MNIEKVINIYKPIGVTPLQVVEQVKRKFVTFNELKIGYAGRLDPMARGVLVLLVGDENKEKKRYEDMDKTYQFDVLWGVASDSYDMLGIVKEGHVKAAVTTKSFTEKIKQFISFNTGFINQQLPTFSAYRVNGKPLFYWARKGIDIEPPIRCVEIKKFEHIKDFSVSLEELKDRLEILRKVRGDFRQGEILNSWDSLLALTNKQKFSLSRFVVEVSSGTYIRSIVNEMGKYLGTGAITYDILRTKVGEYRLQDCITVAEAPSSVL